MNKKKSLLKSMLVCALTAAMLASTTLPVIAGSTDLPEVTPEDAIVNLNNGLTESDTASEQTAPAAAPSPARTDSSSSSSSVSSSPSESAAIDEQMKKALIIVKTYFKIDEKLFPEFYYDVYESNGKTNWSFNWSSSNRDSYLYINVTDELVTSYNKVVTRDEDEGFTFAKLTKAEAEEKAREFLKIVFGDAAKNFDVYSSSLYYSSRSYEISFAVYKDGYVNTAASTPSVSVDKNTGEITNYYYYNTKYESSSAYDEKNYNYQSASKIITPEQAAKDFVKNIGVELKYSYDFDYVTKELKIFPVYTAPDNGKYISAVNGEVVDIYSKYSGISGGVVKESADSPSPLSYDTANGKADNDGGGAVSYTQAETAELDKLKSYISKDEAVKIAVGLWGMESDRLKDYNQSVSLSKNHINQNQYIWNVSFSSSSSASDKYGYRYYYATVDARNGTVISYYDGYSRPSDLSDKDLKYTYDEAKKIVMEEVNKLAGIYGIKNFEFIEGRVDSNEKEMTYNFTWNRVVNGTKFDSNYINAEFDNYTGKISSYSVSWFEDAKFPALEKIISPEEAFNKIVAYSEYFPAYIEKDYDKDKNVSTMSLVYMLKNYWVNVDPYTGDYLDYSGKLDTSEQEPEYDDILGHWCEEVVKILTDNGIYVWGGKFEPDTAISTKDFISYMKFYSDSNYEIYRNYERIYKEYITVPGSNNSEMSEEKANATITKQQAAKIICELLGYEKLASMPEYLIYPFGDEVEDEYKAYITIIYILGAIDGSGKNSYNAIEILTRAEAAQMLYNLLTK